MASAEPHLREEELRSAFLVAATILAGLVVIVGLAHSRRQRLEATLLDSPKPGCSTLSSQVPLSPASASTSKSNLSLTLSNVSLERSLSSSWRASSACSPNPSRTPSSRDLGHLHSTGPLRSGHSWPSAALTRLRLEAVGWEERDTALYSLNSL